MFEQTSEARGDQKVGYAAPFVPARIYLSRDGRYLLHALPDGRIVGRHVNYYRQVLRRGGKGRLAAMCRGSSTKLTLTIVAWIVRLLIVAWMALHPAAHQPVTTAVPHSTPSE